MLRKNFCMVLVMLFTLPLCAQSENWYIQVGVFESKVDINYFNAIGSDIYYSNDTYGFHRYYKGIYKTEAEANQILAKFNQLGFNGNLVAKSELGNACVCNYIPVPKSILNSIKNIFFDFDRSNLKPESRKQLNDLVNIMNDFPNYKVTLRAHTDSKGSNSYNEALSLRRATSAKKYLISRGIASSRIKTETYGEVNPIAKNELDNGTDTEVGRQFNRRVEILILDQDGHQLNRIVDEIEVPKGLEN
ncbi:MAG: OmpA family protein [Saprospiraceae bacterium]